MIPLVDLKAQYQFLKPEIAAAIELVLDSGQFVLGDQVAAFEQEFAHYVGAAEGIGVNTGTSALHLALLAAGVGPDDEVITVPFTFVATVAAIDYTGARAVFVDIDPVNYTMDVTQLERAVTPRTKAIVPVHLYGHSADMDPILEVAQRYGLVVIESAVQGVPSVVVAGPDNAATELIEDGVNGAVAPTAACRSGCSASARKKVRMLRDWGQDRKYHHVLKGFNYRMEGLQGSILRVKLRHLDGWTEARRTHARGYDSLLADAGLVTPTESPWARHVYHVYAVRTRERDALQRTLHANGVQTGIHYPVPVHLQPAYADLGYRAGQFPHAERAADEVLSLPMYPELSRTQREMVGAVMRNEAYVI